MTTCTSGEDSTIKDAFITIVRLNAIEIKSKQSYMYVISDNKKHNKTIHV